jgi:hypothetical protein
VDVASIRELTKDIFLFANITPTTQTLALTDRLFHSFEKAKGEGTEYQKSHDKLVFDAVKQALTEIDAERQLPRCKLKQTLQSSQNNSPEGFLRLVQDRVIDWLITQPLPMDNINTILSKEMKETEHEFEDAVYREAQKLQKAVSFAIFEDLLTDTAKEVDQVMARKQQKGSRR